MFRDFLASKLIPFINMCVYIYICLVFIIYTCIPNNVLFCFPYNWALVLCCVLRFSAAYSIYSSYISKNHVYFSQLPSFFTSQLYLCVCHTTIYLSTYLLTYFSSFFATTDSTALKRLISFFFFIQTA